MVTPARVRTWLGSARVLVAVGVLAPLCTLALATLMVVELRRDAWAKAEQTSRNLLQVIERDIARNIEILDLSVQGVRDNLRTPGLDAVSPILRQHVLFDRSASARDMGALLLIDAAGDVTDDAGAMPPRKVNVADRDYFTVHRDRADVGLYVGRPLRSKLSGEWMFNVSRRVDRPDGSFGGIVLGTIKLSYFGNLLHRIEVGDGGAINLYRTDGVRIMRQPQVEADIGASIGEAPNFRRMVREGGGSFVATSVRDGVERHYTFSRVGDLPLVLNVCVSTADIEREWMGKGMVLGTAVAALCALTTLLSLLFGRAMRRAAAMREELAALSRTDALTGLANRRRFDEALSRLGGTADRTGRPLSLLIVDADHFKRYNDRHGHAVGDMVLAGLGRCLAASAHRPQDLACRIGGEEFAVLLPDTDAAGAWSVAERVHREVAGLSVPAAGIGAGAVTVSVGLAQTGAGVPSADLYRLADGALYEAKEQGRNRTRRAGACGAPTALRLAAAGD